MTIIFDLPLQSAARIIVYEGQENDRIQSEQADNGLNVEEENGNKQAGGEEEKHLDPISEENENFPLFILSFCDRMCPLESLI